MGKNWFVVQTEQNRHVSSSVAIAERGFQAFVPMMQKRRYIAGRYCDITVPRFGTYMFAEFDRDVPGWQELCHGAAKRAGIIRILCNAQMKPSPVPDAAISAIKAYVPPTAVDPEPYRYRPGQRCSVYVAGRRQDAIFLEYRGNRQFVATWIFGAEHTIEVKVADLEPLESIDNEA